MKTTLELPADLLRRIKAKAAVQGRSMKALITEALERTLEQSARPEGGWRKVFGKVKPGALREVDERIRELDRIDPKDWK